MSSSCSPTFSKGTARKTSRYTPSTFSLRSLKTAHIRTHTVVQHRTAAPPRQQYVTGVMSFSVTQFYWGLICPTTVLITAHV